MRGMIGAGLAAAGLMAGCASDGEGACAALERSCRAQCDRDFEENPSPWDYRSCLESCRPDPGAICAG